MSELYPTLAETIEILMEARAQRINVALPGRIEKFNADNQTAECSILVRQRLLCQGYETELRPVAVVPAAVVLFPRGGGHFISFPLKKGDHVMLVFMSRSIDTWRLTGDPADPITFDGHQLEDAVAIPGMYPYSKALPNVDDEALVLGKEGGAVVRVGDEVELGAPGGDYVALAARVEAALRDLKDAIASAAVSPGDGGAAFKANLGAALASWPPSLGAAKVKAT